MRCFRKTSCGTSTEKYLSPQKSGRCYPRAHQPTRVRHASTIQSTHLLKIYHIFYEAPRFCFILSLDRCISAMISNITVISNTIVPSAIQYHIFLSSPLLLFQFHFSLTEIRTIKDINFTYS